MPDYFAQHQAFKWRVFAIGLIVGTVIIVGGVAAQVTTRADRFFLNNACLFRTGTADPNTTVTGNPCDAYLRSTGGVGTTLYVKESGIGTNTGWVGVIGATAIDTSAELTALVTDESGSGALVFGTTPTLTNPTLSGSFTGAEIAAPAAPAVDAGRLYFADNATKTCLYAVFNTGAAVSIACQP